MKDKKLEIINRNRKWAHKKLIDNDSEVYRAFLQMEKAAFADGALKKKVKELIAVGISVRINCESCMQRHIEQAKAAGAAYSEILEAVEVAIEMGGSPATVAARFALQVMAEIYDQ